MAVPNFDPHLAFLSMKAVDSHPVQFITNQNIRKYIISISNHDLIGLRADFHHKNRPSHGKIQSLSLTHRVMDNSLMTPDYISI